MERTRRHRLEDIIFITIAAVICGALSWDDIERYGTNKEPWLRRFLKLDHGIPSHDTFKRFFSILDPEKLEACFMEWMREIAQLTEGEVISIDGKSLRGSKAGNKSIVHRVSAWSNFNGMSLGQLKVNDKSNEITAIPKLLDVLILKGCIVTIDAMGCQRDIAEKIKAGGADYILALKGNQSRLEAQAKVLTGREPASQSTETNRGHGRVETRKCSVYNDLSGIAARERWAGLRSMIRIDSIRQVLSSGKTETETRFHISSLDAGADVANRYVREHWGIENSLHWVLDVAFREDQSRKSSGFSAQNFSIITRIALNLLRNDNNKKRSIRGKRLDAGWNNEYLISMLQN
jgi:predicted transposase YbfD/YdcC